MCGPSVHRYHISCLVQAIEDNAQKCQHNAIAGKEEALFKYYLRDFKEGEKPKPVELFEQKELIATVFADQVERQIYTERASFWNILDSDQEVYFWSL